MTINFCWNISQERLERFLHSFYNKLLSILSNKLMCFYYQFIMLLKQ